MTSETWRTDWISEKCEIAAALSRGPAGGGYGEAVILVSATLNALAAEVWPGRQMDRARFVELLVRFGPTPDVPKTISVPLIIRHLQTAGPTTAAAQLQELLLDFSPTRVITGPEVDKPEAAVLARCCTLSLKTVRKFSYANLLYEEVRSSYAHEYRPGAKSTSWPMTMAQGQPVSYVNRLVDPKTSNIVRLIHFHVNWLMAVAIGAAKSVDAIADTLPQRLPIAWWTEGAQ